MRSKYYCLFILIVLFARCKKLVEVDSPITRTTTENVYKSDATAAAVLTGVYTKIADAGFTGISGISLYGGLSADEFILYDAALSNMDYLPYYRNNLASANRTLNDYYFNLYPLIYTLNSAIEGVSASSALTPLVKQRLLGEAKFMRAFCYFYLVNLYGGVPLAVSTDYKTNASLSRASEDEVWSLIISDLKEAKSLLSKEYLDATVMNVVTPRLRPNRCVATALLARAYLYTGDWSNAAANADSLIHDGSYILLQNLNEVFLSNSTEAIWQLQSVNSGENTKDGLVFNIPPSGPNAYDNPVYLREELVTSFAPGDKRLENWINSVDANGTSYPFAYKYKVSQFDQPVTEYTVIFRLAEQYLIRAEARAMQNDPDGALADLNIIRHRAGLADTTITGSENIRTAILRERRLELFTEWGHRWLDLKRTGTVDEVMTAITTAKGGLWSSNWQWYPIPATELTLNRNLVQNSGY